MSDLIDTTEMYLRTVFELEEECIPPLRARIAERLGQSGPTVSQTVARMERDGLVRVLPDRSLELTATGRAAATRVMRKHRLAECLLVNIIGMPWEDVHEEACRWEHVMSDAAEQRIVALLGNPTVSPFGNPIPSLDEVADGPSQASAWHPLTSALDTSGERLRILRIGEQVQHDPGLMQLLASAGVRPGAVVSAAADGDAAVAVEFAGKSIVLPRWAAELIMVDSSR